MAELAEQLANKPPVDPIWGHFLRHGAVTLLVAEAGAGKTIFTHRLAQCLEAGIPFMGMAPPRPERVFHIDLESDEGTKGLLLDIIPPCGAGWDTLPFGTEPAAARKYLIEAEGYDLAVIDNLQMLYPVANEQDNSLAIQQMTFFTSLAKRKNMGILLIFNTGKEDRNPEFRRPYDYKYLARGASARVERADIVVNMVEEKERGNHLLAVAKDRGGYQGEGLRYTWADDWTYTRVSHTFPGVTLQKTIEGEILACFDTPEPVKREIICRTLKIEPGSARDRLLTRALSHLIATSTITKPAFGLYQKSWTV